MEPESSRPTISPTLDRRRGLDSDRCISLYRKLSSGVCILSAAGPSGPVGLTASTVTSVSLRPPLLLACLATRSFTLAAIQGSGRFGVQLLAEHQQQVAKDFASATGSRFADRDHRFIEGVPILDANLAWAVCELADEREYGDHVLIVGKVVAAGTGVGNPLIWHSQRFVQIADHVREGRILESEGELWNGT